MSGFTEIKHQRNFRLTDGAYNHLSKLAELHGMESKAEVLEHIARSDGELVALPRHIFEIWINEAKDKTSPRYQRLQQLLAELAEYLP